MIFLLVSCNTHLKGQDSSSLADIIPIANAGENRVGFVEQSVVFDGSQSSGVEFEWYFGDGQRSESLLTEHIYSEAGTYQAVLTAWGSDGTWRSDAISVSIQNPPTERVPITSSTIVNTDNHVWALFPENGSLSQFSLTGDRLAEFSICNNPQQLAYSEQVLGISCREPDSMILFSTTENNIQTIDLPNGSQPYGIVGRDERWWVSLSGLGQLAEWTDEGLTTYELGPDPRALSLLHDGRLVSPQWRATEEGAKLYFFEGGEVEQVLLGKDFGGDSDNTTGGSPNLLESVVPTLDGQSVFIPMLHSNTLRGEYRSGNALNFESTVRAMLATIELDAMSESPSARKHFDERGRSSAVACSPDGRLYVLHSGSGHVSILNQNTLENIGSILNVGSGASGLSLSPDGKKLYINSWLNRTIKAYDTIDPSGSPVWESHISSEEPLSEIILKGKRIFHSSADTRITKSQYIACSNCHPDGDHDGQTWDFTDRGEGLRNTTSLLGRSGTSMGPLHWTGNYDEIQDFELDMRFHFGGEGYIDDIEFEECEDSLGQSKAGLSEDLDALAAYIESLPFPPKAPVSPQVGSDVFESLNCDECHPPPLYTDSNLSSFIRHDIGTLKESSGQRLGSQLDGLDTPTLLGLWFSSPYLHDGTASNIAEAIRSHQDYQVLSEGQIEDLVDFLLAL